MTKLKVLLVPDFLPWILGTWAQQTAALDKTHDYYLFSQQMIPHYLNRWDELLHQVDVVHFLNQWEVKRLDMPEHVPRIDTITHVTDLQEWNEQLSHLVGSDALVVIAEEWRQFLRDREIPDEKIHLFNVGVDTQRFYPFRDKPAARKALGIASESTLIGYSAKFTSDLRGRKGADVFLRALEQCADAGYGFGVVITGPGWDAVVQQLEERGIEVYYRPFLPDRLMPALYNAIDLYVCTSRVEGGPAPVLESMACGVPVVTTPVGIVPDHLTHEGDVLVVPKDDANRSAQAMMQLLESPQLRDRLGAAALQTILQQFKWNDTLSEIGALYTSVWRAKTDGAEPPQSTLAMHPEQQRNWAVQVDSYLWHRRMYEIGYRAEGVRGMMQSHLQVKDAKEKARLFSRTVRWLATPHA